MAVDSNKANSKNTSAKHKDIQNRFVKLEEKIEDLIIKATYHDKEYFKDLTQKYYNKLLTKYPNLTKKKRYQKAKKYCYIGLVSKIKKEIQSCYNDPIERRLFANVLKRNFFIFYCLVSGLDFKNGFDSSNMFEQKDLSIFHGAEWLRRLCYYLQFQRTTDLTQELNMQNLIINIQPGAGKTTLTVAYTAWNLILHPGKSMLYLAGLGNNTLKDDISQRIKTFFTINTEEGNPYKQNIVTAFLQVITDISSTSKSAPSFTIKSIMGQKINANTKSFKAATENTQFVGFNATAGVILDDPDPVSNTKNSVLKDQERILQRERAAESRTRSSANLIISQQKKRDCFTDVILSERRGYILNLFPEFDAVLTEDDINNAFEVRESVDIDIKPKKEILQSFANDRIEFAKSKKAAPQIVLAAIPTLAKKDIGNGGYAIGTTLSRDTKRTTKKCINKLLGNEGRVERETFLIEYQQAPDAVAQNPISFEDIKPMSLTEIAKHITINHSFFVVDLAFSDKQNSDATCIQFWIRVDSRYLILVDTAYIKSQNVVNRNEAMLKFMMKYRYGLHNQIKNPVYEGRDSLFSKKIPDLYMENLSAIDEIKANLKRNVMDPLNQSVENDSSKAANVKYINSEIRIIRRHGRSNMDKARDVINAGSKNDRISSAFNQYIYQGHVRILTASEKDDSIKYFGNTNSINQLAHEVKSFDMTNKNNADDCLDCVADACVISNSMISLKTVGYTKKV